MSEPSTNTSSPRLLNQVREIIRIKHYGIRTEQAYVQWIRRYILYHRKRHPRDMGAKEVSEFLSSLAITAKVAASTQNQALPPRGYLSIPEAASSAVISAILPFCRGP